MIQGSREYAYRIVDVFTTRRLEGNALAVFPNAEGLDDGTMQGIARELNLAETVFLLPSRRDDCVARARIFTPRKEMRFAGHPTLGAAYVLADERGWAGPASLLLEEEIGAIPVTITAEEGSVFWLSTPPIRYGPTFDTGVCARVLGLRPQDLLDATPQLLDAGNPVLFVPVVDESAVDRTWLDAAGSATLGSTPEKPFCVVVFAPTAEGAYARMFAPDYGIPEDPATGSAAGPLAAFAMQHGLAPSAAGTRLIITQGVRMQRRSLLHVWLRGESGSTSIDVGGNVTPVAAGWMTVS